MCVSPIKIKNPNIGISGEFAKYKDIKSAYIYVPCGKCGECVHNKQLQLIQRVQLESNNAWCFFVTLTYNNESLPIYTTPDGIRLKYADTKDVVNMLKRIRNDDLFKRPFRYFFVSERGHERARPHFHLILFLKKLEDDNIFTPYNLESFLFPLVLDQWKRNYGSKRKPIYKPLCTYVRKRICGKINTTYDLHYIQPSTLDGTTSDVAFYVTKYMLKTGQHDKALQSALKLNYPPEIYKAIWNKVKSRWLASKNLGFGVFGLQNKSNVDRLSALKDSDTWNIIKDSISRSRSSGNLFPCLYNLENGKTMPLAKYWKRCSDLFTLDDYKYFHDINPELRDDNMIMSKNLDMETYLKDKNSINRQLSIIDDNETNFNILID